MSEQEPTTDHIAPKPEPETEPGEPKPGGADAVDDAPDRDPSDGSPVTRDLGPEENPAVEDVLPDEMRELEDTDTEATKDGGRDVEPHEESPA